MALFERVLQPYVRRKEPGVVTRLLLMLVLVGLGIFYGLMASLLPPDLLFVPMVPIFLLAGVCLWMLPDIGIVRVQPMQKAMLWYVLLFAAWPNYVALDLPGLPWITPQRIAVGMLALYFLTGVAMSEDFRTNVMESLRQDKLLYRLFWLFWALTSFSLLFSNSMVFSINRYVNNQIFWTMLALAAAYFARFRGFADQVLRFSLIGLIVALVLSVYELRIEKVFWVENLPFFLKVDPVLLAKAMAAQARAGTDIYRVRGTMLVALYFAEYLTMLFPFLLFGIARASTLLHKLLLSAAVVAAMVVMWGTNARSAMVGMLLTLVIYFFFSVWRWRQRNPGSIVAMAGVMAFPAAVSVLAMLVVFWNRLHVMVLGGGQHQASSDARGAQWDMGIPKVLQLPLGHGPGRAADVLGYTNLGGEATIDTYYLSILLEYGVLALPVFILCFALPLWLTFRNYRHSPDPETDLIMPLALALFNFVVIKGVLSSEGNMPLAFIMLGLFVGLLGRIRDASGGERVLDVHGYDANSLPVPAKA